MLFFLLHSESSIFENFMRIRARQIYYVNLTTFAKKLKLEIYIFNFYIKNSINNVFKKVSKTYNFIV
jgi:hypothetical protein